MGCKHNGIDPSTDGERTTLHSLETPQHCLYYCAPTFTSFPVCRVQLTNILPVKTSLVDRQPKIAGCGLGKQISDRGESLLIPLPLTFTLSLPKASPSALNLFPAEDFPLVFY